MQNACRLVRASARVDIGSALQQERRDLELSVHPRPGQRYVQDVLRVGGCPMQIPQSGGVVGGVMPTETPQPGTTSFIKPTLHSREVPYWGRVRKIVGQRPNRRQ